MESHDEQIARVEAMTHPTGGRNDLYDKDIEALETVLKERAELLEACKLLVVTFDTYLSSPRGYRGYKEALRAIANAEGRA